MSAYTLTDGTTVVSFYPEWNITLPDTIVVSENRTDAGALYRYVWGVFKCAHFEVQYVSSSDMCVINSWWGASTPVVLWDMSSSTVVSGYITNPTRPIDALMPPYTDQFGGSIQLDAF
jgi:hypothetical protein